MSNLFPPLGPKIGSRRFMRHIPKHTVSIRQQLRAIDVRLINTAFFLDFSFSYSSRRRKTLFAMSL